MFRMTIAGGILYCCLMKAIVLIGEAGTIGAINGAIMIIGSVVVALFYPTILMDYPKNILPKCKNAILIFNLAQLPGTAVIGMLFAFE